MTREEIIKSMSLQDAIQVFKDTNCYGTMDIAKTVILKALEQEPILDKIRAEILEEKECAYADFERYKVEYLGQDSEDVLDSLPQDDFRYGMERCIDIIDKHKGESEVRDGK